MWGEIAKTLRLGYQSQHTEENKWAVCEREGGSNIKLHDESATFLSQLLYLQYQQCLRRCLKKALGCIQELELNLHKSEKENGHKKSFLTWRSSTVFCSFPVVEWSDVCVCMSAAVLESLWFKQQTDTCLVLLCMQTIIIKKKVLSLILLPYSIRRSVLRCCWCATSVASISADTWRQRAGLRSAASPPEPPGAALSCSTWAAPSGMPAPNLRPSPPTHFSLTGASPRSSAPPPCCSCCDRAADVGVNFWQKLGSTVTRFYSFRLHRASESKGFTPLRRVFESDHAHGLRKKLWRSSTDLLKRNFTFKIIKLVGGSEKTKC